MDLGGFAEAVDALLADNARFVAVCGGLFAAHVVVGIEAIARWRLPRLMAGLTLAVALAALLYKVSQYLADPGLFDAARRDLAGNADVRLVAYEGLVAVVAAFALGGRRLAGGLSAAAFLVHALAAAAALLLTLTFSLDRLA